MLKHWLTTFPAPRHVCAMPGMADKKG